MTDFLRIDVSGHTEKKGALTYLSWCWAWAEVLKIDPEATWELVEYEDDHGTRQPCMWLRDESAIVKVSVTIGERTRTAVLPVMNNRNQAIKNPDAFAINTAVMRCMTKAVAMFGIGLYIYAGEDLPEGETHAPKVKEPERKTATPAQSVTPPDPPTPETATLNGIRERLAEQPASNFTPPPSEQPSLNGMAASPELLKPASTGLKAQFERHMRKAQELEIDCSEFDVVLSEVTQGELFKLDTRLAQYITAKQHG